MKITREWLNANISRSKNNVFQVSHQQLAVLKVWFPEIVISRENTPLAGLKKGWIKYLIGKEITGEQAAIFYKASFYGRPTWAEKKAAMIELRTEAMDQCKKLQGEYPEHPHYKFISCIAKVDGTILKKISFEKDNTTTVIFSFKIDDKERSFKAVCAKGPLSYDVKPYVIDTKLYEIKIDENGIESDTLIKDCTGLEIRDCILELTKKKRAIIKRKKPTSSESTGSEKPRIIVRKRK